MEFFPSKVSGFVVVFVFFFFDRKTEGSSKTLTYPNNNQQLTHPTKMRRNSLQLTPCVPSMSPIVRIAPHATIVVETGRPKREARTTVIAAESSMQKPRELVSLADLTARTAMIL